MKKLLLTLFLLLGIVWGSFAQTSVADGPEGGSKFSVGLDLGIPIGNAQSIYELGAGASLKYSYFVATQTAFTLSAGYTAFIVNDQLTGQGAQSAYSYAPVKAGVKYYFAPSFYAEGQFGVTFFLESGGGTLFTYAPGVGYNFGGGVDVAVRYESWTNNGSVNQVALRLAYSF